MYEQNWKQLRTIALAAGRQRAELLQAARFVQPQVSPERVKLDHL